MTANYELEQNTLKTRSVELQKMIDDTKEITCGAERFMEIVRNKTYIKELDAKTLREFVEKIYVHQKVDFEGHKIQCIDIAWNFIGIFDPPSEIDEMYK